MFISINAQLHSNCIVNQYVRHCTLPQMEWPARSPNLNLIEYVCHAQETSSVLCNPPRNLDYWAMCLQEWKQILQDAAC
ncbi:hypothetical protein TNCV_13961 [Trichonephila clavipes]|nr:hypothetical protein TNCV_13961 [Trichonephila clavipes]